VPKHASAEEWQNAACKTFSMKNIIENSHGIFFLLLDRKSHTGDNGLLNAICHIGFPV